MLKDTFENRMKLNYLRCGVSFIEKSSKAPAVNSWIIHIVLYKGKKSNTESIACQWNNQWVEESKNYWTERKD